MTTRTLIRASGTAALTGFALCAVFGGWKGAAGFALGSSATGFGLAVWSVITSLIATMARNEAAPRSAVALVIVAFLFKIPLYVGAVVLVYRLGGAAPGCFVAGLGLVYLCLVGRLFTDGTTQPS